MICIPLALCVTSPCKWNHTIVNMIINWIYGRTLIRSRLIRPLSGSTFRTRTSTRSPGPSARLRRRWLTGSLSRLILLLWMRPERPTPISTKAPNKAVLSTRPVSTAPTRRSLIDTMPRLKSACPKSEDGKKREKKKKMRWLGVNKGDQVQVSTHVWGKRQRKGMPESKWQGRNDTDITFPAATQYLCLHTSTFLSILLSTTFHPARSL